jgi:hypothetical protein
VNLRAQARQPSFYFERDFGGTAGERAAADAEYVVDPGQPHEIVLGGFGS